MVDIEIIFYILLAHFIGDFVLQTRWMARGKSSLAKPLLAHVMAYTATLGLVSLAMTSPEKSLSWAITNGMLHGCVDFFTSRISKRCWAAKREYLTFLTIGADQTIHLVSLIWLWHIM